MQSRQAGTAFSLGRCVQYINVIMKRVFYISALTLFLAIGCEDDEPKIDKSIIGSWSIIQIDSLSRVVYPGGDTSRTTIISDEGSFKFYNHCRGFVDSRKVFFSDSNKFRWYYYSGEIEFKTENCTTEPSPVTILGQDTIFFNIAGCEYRLGVEIWYETTLKKDI